MTLLLNDMKLRYILYCLKQSGRNSWDQSRLIFIFVFALVVHDCFNLIRYLLNFRIREKRFLSNLLLCTLFWSDMLLAHVSDKPNFLHLMWLASEKSWLVPHSVATHHMSFYWYFHIEFVDHWKLSKSLSYNRYGGVSAIAFKQFTEWSPKLIECPVVWIGIQSILPMISTN